MNNDVLFSSVRQDWETPDEIFNGLSDEFGITFDVCADPSNAKCYEFWTVDDNCLTKEWAGVCFMNPPYGNAQHPCKSNCKKKICESRGYHYGEHIPGVADFVKKAAKEAIEGRATTVALLPARTDTEYFHLHIYGKPNVEIRFVRGRIKFKGAPNCAPFPSMVVIFHKVEFSVSDYGKHVGYAIPDAEKVMEMALRTIGS